MTPERGNKEDRVRLGVETGDNGSPLMIDGAPVIAPRPLRVVRDQRRKGFIPSVITKELEYQTAQALLAKRAEPGRATKEKQKQPEFILRFESVIKAIQEAENQEKATKLPEDQQALALTNPIKIMADHTLDYMGKPLPIVSSEQWELMKKLTEAAKIFYTDRGYKLMVESGAEAKASVLSEAIHYWIEKGTLLTSSETVIEKETVPRFLRALARIRDADSLYYQGMFFPGRTDQVSFVPNLASLYEKTATELRRSLPKSEVNGSTESQEHRVSLKKIIATLEREADSLRIIQAQDFEFITYDRPTETEVVLLNLTNHLVEQIEDDRKSGSLDYDKYARQILDVLRARRCSLTNEEVQKVCSFLLRRPPRSIRRVLTDGGAPEKGPRKKGVTERIPYHHLLPWVLLQQAGNQEVRLSRLIERGAEEEEVEKERAVAANERYLRLLRSSPSPGDRRPTVCRALSKITFPPKEAMENVVPCLLLKMRQMGYLGNITQEFYRGLNLEPSLWENHQLALLKEKPFFSINQGDIVIFVPLSGWCITNAHRELAIAARDLAPALVRIAEIQNHQPPKDRKVKVIFTFGESAEKKVQGMPPAAERIKLGQEAVKMEENIFVVPFGYINEGEERSERIKQLMTKFSADFNISWSTYNPQSPNHPGEGCIPIIVGGTDKLGPVFEGTRPTRFLSPGEDNDFLNNTAQITALLQEDIDSPFKMSAFISAYLNRFNLDGPGGTLLITSVSDVHSSQASDLLQSLAQAIKDRDKIRQRKCYLAFLTMVPPRIAKGAWEMICRRAERYELSGAQGALGKLFGEV